MHTTCTPAAKRSLVAGADDRYEIVLVAYGLSETGLYSDSEPGALYSSDPALKADIVDQILWL
jgi:hypothetical protein